VGGGAAVVAVVAVAVAASPVAGEVPAVVEHGEAGDPMARATARRASFTDETLGCSYGRPPQRTSRIGSSLAYTLEQR
jgi:hypothetical protein